MKNSVNAMIVRDPAGICRIYCQRAKHKWWFELGRHRETDIDFERAFGSGTVNWMPCIKDRTKLF